MSRQNMTARGTFLCIAGALPLLVLSAATSAAQDLERVTLTTSPSFTHWRFADEVPQDSLRVRAVSQYVTPLQFDVSLAARWRVSVSGAAQSTTVDAGLGKSLSFTGLGDTRIRALGPLFSDGVLLTVGVNVPTGGRTLDATDNAATRIIAAPALASALPSPAVGLGATIGLVFSRPIGDWASALGVSVERRGAFTPFEAQLVGVPTRNELQPGPAAHVSLGLEGLVGAHRLSIGTLVDVYGTDRVTLERGALSRVSDSYRLGPTFTGAIGLDVASSAIHDFRIRLTNRYRTAFSDSSRKTVAGSSGNYLDGSITGALGSPGATQLVLGLIGRRHTGLRIEESFVGASTTAGGVLVGLSVPSSRMVWRPTVQWQAGSLTTARIATSFTALSFNLTLEAR